MMSSHLKSVNLITSVNPYFQIRSHNELGVMIWKYILGVTIEHLQCAVAESEFKFCFFVFGVQMLFIVLHQLSKYDSILGTK